MSLLYYLQRYNYCTIRRKKLKRLTDLTELVACCPVDDWSLAHSSFSNNNHVAVRIPINISSITRNVEQIRSRTLLLLLLLLLLQQHPLLLLPSNSHIFTLEVWGTLPFFLTLFRLITQCFFLSYFCPEGGLTLVVVLLLLAPFFQRPPGYILPPLSIPQKQREKGNKKLLFFPEKIHFFSTQKMCRNVWHAHLALDDCCLIVFRRFVIAAKLSNARLLGNNGPPPLSLSLSPYVSSRSDDLDQALSLSLIHVKGGACT